MSNLENLPADITRHKVVGSADAAAFCNISLPHWRRLYRAGKVPAPLKLSERKLGWRVGDLVEWVSSQVREAA